MRSTDPTTGKPIVRKHLRRFDNVTGPRELTFSCFRGYQFFRSDRSRQWFVDEMLAARAEWPIQIYAYVIMPEHVHLIVYSNDAALEVGRVVGKIKERVTRRAIKHLAQVDSPWLERIAVQKSGRTRHQFWQPGGGFDRNVLEDSTLRKMIDYIHANPVRRGLVQRPENWQWSSAGWYAGLRPVRIEMDDVGFLALQWDHKQPRSKE